MLYRFRGDVSHEDVPVAEKEDGGMEEGEDGATGMQRGWRAESLVARRQERVPGTLSEVDVDVCSVA